VWRDLGAIRIPHVGQAHCAEQDGIGRFGPLERLRRQGLAGTPVKICARLAVDEVECKAPDPLRHGLQESDTRRHHLGPDAVAREDRNFKLAHTHP